MDNDRLSSKPDFTDMNHTSLRHARGVIQRLTETTDVDAVLLVLHELQQVIIEDGNGKPTTLEAVGDRDDGLDPAENEDLRHAMLKSYLPPLYALPHAMLDVMYARDRDNERLAERVRALFSGVHRIYGCGALAAYLSPSRKVTSRLWRMVQAVMIPVDECLSQMCDMTMWEHVFPGKSWDRSVDLIVAWLIIFHDASTRIEAESHEDAASESLLVEWTVWIVKAVRLNRHGFERRLLGTFLSRFINRGAGDVVVDAILRSCSEISEDDRSWICHLIPSTILDAHAKEHFFLKLLSHLTRSEAPETNCHLLRDFAIDNSTGQIQNDICYVLFQRLLVKTLLNRRGVRILVELLQREENGEIWKVVYRVATIWSDKKAIETSTLPQQGYWTYILTSLISILPEGLLEIHDSKLYRLILDGVSNRLDNCLETVRFQGMRIAKAIAALQPTATTVFENLDVDFLTLRDEEEWEDSPSHEPAAVSASHIRAQEKEADSDDESDFFSSVEEDDDLEPFPEDAAPKTLMKEQRPVTLMDVYQEMKNTEDSVKNIHALQQLVVLVKERPRELTSMASEICRVLVHISLPEWIHEELRKEKNSELKDMKTSTVVRSYCLSRLLTAVPIECGRTVPMIIASRQLAEYQRLEILEAMRLSAKELSSTTPRFLTPPHTPAGTSHPGDTAPSRIQSEAKHGSVMEIALGERNRARVRGGRPLAAAANQEKSTMKNRFVEVVSNWTSSLLMVCQTRTHGFNIMERNPIVLASILMTFGSFAECATESIASTSLALTTFPLFKEVLEQKGDNCCLRRVAFQSLSSLIKAIPAARLISVLSPSGLLLRSKDEVDITLDQMVHWTVTYMSRASRSDTDKTCRLLASHSLQVMQEVMERATDNRRPIEFRMPSRTASIEYRIPMTSDNLP